MYGLNRFTGIGRLTEDPDFRHLADGTPLCRMRLAFNRKYKGRDGELKDKALFLNCVAWKKLAELCSGRLTKGARVYAEGELVSSSYQKKDGTQGYSLEINANRITFLDARPADAASQQKIYSNFSPAAA